MLKMIKRIWANWHSMTYAIAILGLNKAPGEERSKLSEERLRALETRDIPWCRAMVRAELGEPYPDAEQLFRAFHRARHFFPYCSAQKRRESHDWLADHRIPALDGSQPERGGELPLTEEFFE